MGALYVGRLSSEKGIDTLLRAWTGVDVPLRVIGDGPMRELVESAAGPRIGILGRKTPAEIGAEMAWGSFLIQPSIAPETFGMAVAEAYCQNLPVIASRIGALAEIVQDDATGLLFSLGDADDLARPRFGGPIITPKKCAVWESMRARSMRSGTRPMSISSN